MLKNAYLDAKIGFDTAKNEPSEKCGFGCCYNNLRSTLYENASLPKGKDLPLSLA